MCLTSFAFMTIAAGILYGAHGNHPMVIAALKGSSAAAVGLLAATWYQLGKKSVRDFFDATVIVLAVIAINDFKLSVPVTLLGVGAIAIFHHRPGNKPQDERVRRGSASSTSAGIRLPVAAERSAAAWRRFPK